MLPALPAAPIVFRMVCALGLLAAGGGSGFRAGSGFPRMRGM
jgi:hypothetical protein